MGRGEAQQESKLMWREHGDINTKGYGTREVKRVATQETNPHTAPKRHGYTYAHSITQAKTQNLLQTKQVGLRLTKQRSVCVGPCRLASALFQLAGARCNERARHAEGGDDGGFRPRVVFKEEVELVDVLEPNESQGDFDAFNEVTHF